ncbi:MAG: tryptophan transporter [Filifactoraceae bacterium]
MEKSNLTLTNSNLTTKELVATGLLLSLGFILHAITPPIFMGIKPDFLLSCMFVAIISCPKSSNTLLAGIVSGIISAMTTGFPAGQIPSMIEKLATAYVCYFMIKHLFKFNYNKSKIFALGLICTIISGIIFLYIAGIIAGLPGSFITLVTTIIIPTAIMNAIVTQILYKAYSLSKRK